MILLVAMLLLAAPAGFYVGIRFAQAHPDLYGDVSREAALGLTAGVSAMFPPLASALALILLIDVVKEERDQP